MLASLLAAFMLSGLAATEPCRFQGEPETWTRQALESWDQLDRERIRMAHPATPTLILFDQTCVYQFTPSTDGAFTAGGRTYTVAGAPHQGQVEIPGGGSVPARKLSFAAPTGDGGMFFVMGLPALWRADTDEARDPELLAMLVFMHEFAHTQQGDGLGRRIDDLITRGLPEDATDDTLQELWSGDPAYVAAYERERDLLYRAADARDATAARAWLAQARSAMTDRRETFLTEPIWRDADDVFLTFEGSGNWAAWVWLSDPRGGALTPQAATAFVRGSGRWWSQDEGLALMQALDQTTPDWPSLTFGPEGTTGDPLIARALQPSMSSE